MSSCNHTLGQTFILTSDKKRESTIKNLQFFQIQDDTCNSLSAESMMHLEVWKISLMLERVDNVKVFWLDGYSSTLSV